MIWKALKEWNLPLLKQNQQKDTDRKLSFLTHDLHKSIKMLIENPCVMPFRILEKNIVHIDTNLLQRFSQDWQGEKYWKDKIVR